MPPRLVVITGGGGFVGKYLREELEQAWPSVSVISWDVPEVDITKPESYERQLAELQPEWVVHLAAIASVPLALKQPELVKNINVEGTRKLLEMIRSQSPSSRVLIVSSSEVYGRVFNDYGERVVPELGLDELMPLNAYAESKKEMEELIEAEFNEMCIRVRPFPHFGPGQKEGFVTADFAVQIARIEKGDQRPVIKVGNLESARDFTDVRDVVRAYRLLMEKGQMGEVYNVASGRAVRIQAILDALLALSKVDIEVEQDLERMRASEVPVAVGDAKKLREATGWQPERAWQDTLVEVLNWWRSTV